MYQVLARKLRPTQFKDVVGQEHITKSLQNSILKNKIGHAYIFSGTRGVGKTTVARIFAKAIRCDNNLVSGDACNECKACKDFETNSSLDVLEIDGASNNSVDDIRELVLNVQYLPSFGKHKVYIIDEVHMLSTSAFNALLKTLEEPPEHIIFIFATTEPSKLLDTVLSRCQKFDFLSASMESLTKLIKKIATLENISFEDDTLIRKICEAGNESFRDTLSLLDQVLSFSDENIINEDVLVVSLGLARTSAIKTIVESMLDGDLHECSNVYRGLIRENVSLVSISKSILDYFYDILQVWQREDIQIAEVYWVYETFAKEVNWTLESISPKKTLELLIQKICLRRQVFKTKLTLDETSKKKVESPKVDTVLEVEKKFAQAEKLSELNTESEESLDNVVTKEVHIDEEPCEKKTVEKADEEKNWLNFIKYLSATSPASASTLEQGNLLTPLVHDQETVKIKLGFTKASEVFLEYLNDEKAYESLVSNIGIYFKCSKDNVSLELQLVDSEKEEGFTSLADINRKKDEEEIENKKNAIRTNPLIIEAEKMFNSTVDKVILGKK